MNTKKLIEDKLNKLLRDEVTLRNKGNKVAKPYLDKAHKVHLRWSKLYKKYLSMIWVKDGLRKKTPVLDGEHGRDGYTHCGNQRCCWGPRGSRVGAPRKRK